MDAKDWILLIIPIVFNGLIVFIAQRIISDKIDHSKKRNELRDKALILFYEKLQRLNDIFIEANINVLKKTETHETGLQALQDQTVRIMQFYDTNSYDLDIFSDDYKVWVGSWQQFQSIYNQNVGIPLTDGVKEQAGQALQNVKDQTQNLIKRVREKY